MSMRRSAGVEANIFVLDTSAVVAVLEEELESAAIVDLLTKATQGQVTVLLPFVTLMEREHILLRRLQPEQLAGTMSLLDNWPVTVVESKKEWRHEAARIKAEGGLSLADAWIAALATLSDAQLVHKDPEFDAVAGLRSARL